MLSLPKFLQRNKKLTFEQSIALLQSLKSALSNILEDNDKLQAEIMVHNNVILKNITLIKESDTILTSLVDSLIGITELTRHVAYCEEVTKSNVVIKSLQYKMSLNDEKYKEIFEKIEKIQSDIKPIIELLK